MKKAPLLWILRHLRRRMLPLAALTASSAANAVLLVAFALGSRGVIDGAAAGDPALFRPACVRLAAIIAGVLLTLALNRHLRERLLADMERDWKRTLLHGLLHGRYDRVSAYHSAELLNRLNNDVARLNDGVVSLLPGAVSMITRLLAAVIVLGTLDPVFTLVIAGAGGLAVLLTGLMRRRLKELNKQVSTQDGIVSAFLQELMEKLLMVQAMDAGAEAERRSEKLMEDRYRVQRKRKNVSLAANTGVSLMAYGAHFLALVWCAAAMLRGTMSFGALTAVLQLVGQLQAPFVNLSGTMPKYIAMIAAAERLMELEQIPAELPRREEDPAELYEKMEAIGGRNLSFSYDRSPVLCGADFRLEKGSFTAVTGSSGIGKSTLLKLLLGVCAAEEGRLVLDLGEEELPLDRSTRALFAYVPQGNLLLSGTVRENLTIACPGATQQQLEQAIFVSAMDEFLDQLPQGLDTPLGENGTGLSEGQAQRLAIARAVLGAAPVLLLDECTSALDEATERTVLQRLKALPGRTCIAVTHRPAAQDLCTHRLEIRDGKIYTH